MGKLKEIDDAQYKVDFEISKDYIQFSAELLRLSLLAMGSFGALVLIKIKGEAGSTAPFLHDPDLFLLAMVLFAGCAGASLFHRYFAADGLSWYVAWLRTDAEGDTKRALEERTGFHRLLKRSKWSLIAAEIFFGGGVLVFVIALFCLLKT